MTNFLDPAILFFIFGVFAGCVKSNLEVPPQISRFLSLYLLMALGLKGGFALHKSGFTSEIAFSLGLAIFLAIIIPIIGYLLLRRSLNVFDAAAIAATYGSVSAVTFITATQYLDQFNIDYGGHMAAAMALMESPAIILAIVGWRMSRGFAESAAKAQVQQQQAAAQPSDELPRGEDRNRQRADPGIKSFFLHDRRKLPNEARCRQAHGNDAGRHQLEIAGLEE